MFASGAREQARCRVQYKRATRTSFSVRGVCATASGRASQVATIHRIGNNRYQGRFYNSEYGISGTISVVVRGSSQSVHLTSESGYASLRLTR